MALSCRSFGRPWRVWAALLASWLLSCTASELPRTELVVIVDTDLALGDELDKLRIEATGPDDTTQSAEVELPAGAALPQTLGLVHQAGSLGPIQVVAVGLLGEQEVVRREASLSFIANKTLSLPLHLVRACLARACGADSSCTEHGCASSDVDATRLADWRGHPPTLAEPDEPPAPEDAGSELDAATNEEDGGDSEHADAGTPDLDGGESDAASEQSDADQQAPEASLGEDGGMCMPKVEACNELDDDCDGIVDNGYDLMTDSRHCGMCNKACAQPTPICCRGACSRNCR